MDSQLVKLKHDRSAAQYPEIDLRDDEYVVLAMKRSTIGVAAIWVVVGMCIFALSVILVMLSKGDVFNKGLFPMNAAAKHYLWMAIALFYVVIVVAGLIGQMVYTSNLLWVTNRRAIQKIRVSLFANSTQVIELAKIEDVSFRQTGILQSLFHIGTLRMSTVGAETTYTFPMLDTPRDEVEIISGLVYEARHRKKGNKESYDPPYYHSARARATVATAVAEDDALEGITHEEATTEEAIAGDIVEAAKNTHPEEAELAPKPKTKATAKVADESAEASVAKPASRPRARKTAAEIADAEFAKNDSAVEMPSVDPSLAEPAPRPSKPAPRPRHRKHRG